MTSAVKTDKSDAMSQPEPFHFVTIDWSRGKWSGISGKYSREHAWMFAGGVVVKASDAIAPMGLRGGKRLDSLKAYVATIASGHMLAWLHAAFSHGAEVESYLDPAEGVLCNDAAGALWISEVILKPQIAFAAGQTVTTPMRTHLHELAQRDCFIARSVKTKITVHGA